MPHCEPLEKRQLMSLTIEVRNTDGTSTANVSTVGQVLTLDVLAVVSSSSNDPTGDGLEDLTGSLVSTASGSASVAGNLAAVNLSPFRSNGAQPGTQQDLNGDGNLDLGSNDPVDTSDYFFARAQPAQDSSTGTIVGNTLEFNIATLTYTVTSLGAGGQTGISFIPYVDPAGVDNAGWMEDGSPIYPAIGGVFQGGSAFTVSDPTLVTPPVAANDSATVAKNTPTVINELKNDTVIDPLNLSSVVASTPAHGSTTLQSDGTLLYTPATGYTGADSFTYTVADTGGMVSNSATVSINVVATPAPIAGAVAATTFLDQVVNVNVLSHDSSTATLVPASVAITGNPAHGTAAVQPDGSINYTPSNGFIGTDTFTYTVGDSNNETSSAATVTLTVNTPVAPTANNDTFTVGQNTPTPLDVLANDTLGSITTGAKVYVTSAATNGTAIVQSDNTILYTPTTGYNGSDSFQYVVVDSVGEASAAASVGITVSTTTPPIAGSFNQQVLTNTGNTIAVLSNVSGSSVVVPTSLAIATAPGDGTATVSNGSILYTPTAGFVGTDSFTYTVADSSGQASVPGTVTLDVGTSISNVKGAAHSLSFIDAAGGLETVSLNRGTAELFFTGTGSLTVAKNSKATVTGSGLNLSDIQLTGTTAASALSIKGSVKTPVTVAGISGSALLGSISAPSANLSGTIDLPSVGAISAGTITNATITIGAGAPGHFALTSGAVSNTTLTSAVRITSIRSTAWAGTQTITAPALASLSIATGGITAALMIAGAIGSMTIGGTVSGTINAASIKSLHTTGAMTAATITTTGNIGTIFAASIGTSTIAAGVTAGTTLAGATGAALGKATISSIRANGFASTDILAARIGAASVGTITTDNGGTAFGFATDSFSSFASTSLKLSHKLLLNQSVLAAYVTQKGISLGDFGIAIE
jgi:hypothetical protein